MEKMLGKCFLLKKVKDVQEFKEGKQSIETTAKGQGTKHGKAGKEMEGPYRKMKDYINSYLVGKGAYDGKHLMVFDPQYKDEELYRDSFTKAEFDKHIEKAVQDSDNVTSRRERGRGRRIEDTDAGVNFDRQARIEDRGEGLTMKKIAKNLFEDSTSKTELEALQEQLLKGEEKNKKKRIELEKLQQQNIAMTAVTSALKKKK